MFRAWIVANLAKLLAAALLVALASLAWLWVDAAQARAQLATLRADVDRQVRDAEASARAVESRRVKRLQEAQDAELLARQAAQRDAAAAHAAADGLRQRAQAFAAASCSASDHAAAAGGPAAADGPGVLADVLSGLADRADQLAVQADTARIAGQLCERAYDALK